MFKCVLFYFVYILSICAETPDVIIQIYEEKAVGDKNQIIGVVNTFKKYKSGIDIVDYPCKSDTDPSVIANKIIKLKISNPSKKYLVIGVGNTAFAVFDRLSSKTDSHIQTLALGHQWMPGYDALIDKVTFIAVPEYSMEKPPKNMTKTIIILTNGVSHAATHASLLKEYEEYNNTLPLTPNDRVVILGGDAPNAANEIQLFNEEDVRKLAAGLISNSPDGKFYIINGPRTGKHDLENGTHKDNKIDKITNMFINILKSKGISEDRIKLFNFQFGEKSLYLPLIGAALHSKSGVWVPGESSSMICEVISNISPEKVIIYKNSAMNKTHEKHVNSVYDQGRAMYYSDGNIRPLNKKNALSLPDAQDQIVKFVTEHNIS